MILTKDEYEREKESFLNANEEDIKKLLIEEKKKYLDKYLKDKNWKEFAKDYMFGLWIILFFGVYAVAGDVDAVKDFVVFILLELFAFGYAYKKWQEEMKFAAVDAYSNMTQSLVRDYIAEKMREEINATDNEDEFQKLVQFYAVALCDIPRNVRFGNVFDM